MERLDIFISLVILLTSTLIIAEPPSQYGTPSFGNFNRNQNQDVVGFQSFRQSFSGGRNGQQNDPGMLGADIPGPKIFRHISLFVAPEDPSDEQPRLRTIRPQSHQDKHIQIIFIRSQSQSSSQPTEIVLPPSPEQKTLVYVLVKKPTGNGSNVKIRQPISTTPAPPEVFFIKYKDGDDATSVNANQIQGHRGSSGGVRNLGSGYGVPH